MKKVILSVQNSEQTAAEGSRRGGPVVGQATALAGGWGVPTAWRAGDGRCWGGGGDGGG